MPTIQQLAAGLQRARELAVPLVPDALMVAGAFAIAYGAWLVHPAAGFVVGGGLSLTAGVLAARLAARKETE